MEKRTDLAVGDRIRMKKKHPCGSDTWEIMRTGADLRLRCEGCGRQIMVERRMVEKNLTGVLGSKEKL